MKVSSSARPALADQADRAPTLRERMFVTLQHALPQHALTAIVYQLTRSRITLLKNALIGAFVKHFRPDMSEAQITDPLAFTSFNEFFTRALRPGARFIDPGRDVLVSPVDGTVSQAGDLDGARILQAKGHEYSLQALLDAGGKRWSSRFAGGSFATLYLAPFNYHRIHMPLEATLRAAWYVPGKLYSVNAVTAAAVDGLFARNERVVCVFERGATLFAMVFVGALFVGSIETVWHGEITPRRPRTALELPLEGHQVPLSLGKGAEVGRFNMGSTVILLAAPGTLRWLPSVVAGTGIAMGQPLGQVLTHD